MKNFFIFFIFMLLIFIISCKENEEDKLEISNENLSSIYNIDLDKNELFITVNIDNIKEKTDYLLFPDEAGFIEEGNNEVINNLEILDSEGNNIEVEKAANYTPEYFAIKMYAYKINIPEDGKITIKAEIKENKEKTYMGWQIMNNFEKGYLQLSPVTAFFTLDSFAKKGITGRYNLNVAGGEVLKSSLNQNNGWYYFDFYNPDLVFVGDYQLNLFKNENSTLNIYLSEKTIELEREQLNAKLEILNNIIIYISDLYQNRPNPKKEMPFEVSIFINYDEVLDMEGTAGVCTPNNLINILTCKDLTQFVENTTHEILHLYNAYAFKGEINEAVGRESDTFWVMEGFNEYTTHKFLLEIGYYSNEEFWEYMKGLSEYYLNSDWKDDYTLPEAAYLYNDSATISIVYLKGCLTGLYFDKKIQEKSNGKNSIKDVLKELHKNYNYYEEKYYSSQDVVNIMNSLVINYDFTEDYNFIVLGKEDINFSFIEELK